MLTRSIGPIFFGTAAILSYPPIVIQMEVMCSDWKLRVGSGGEWQEEREGELMGVGIGAENGEGAAGHGTWLKEVGNFMWIENTELGFV